MKFADKKVPNIINKIVPVCFDVAKDKEITLTFTADELVLILASVNHWNYCATLPPKTELKPYTYWDDNKKKFVSLPA
jgi:hypothetical protein